MEGVGMAVRVNQSAKKRRGGVLGWLRRLCRNVVLRPFNHMGEKPRIALTCHLLERMGDPNAIAVIAQRVPQMAERYQIELATRLQPALDMDEELAECEKESIFVSSPSTSRLGREVLTGTDLPIIVGP